MVELKNYAIGTLSVGILAVIGFNVLDDAGFSDSKRRQMKKDFDSIQRIIQERVDDIVKKNNKMIKRGLFQVFDGGKSNK